MTDHPHFHVVPNAHGSVGVRLFSLGAQKELRLSIIAKLALDLSLPTARVVSPPPIVCEDEPDRDGPMGAISGAHDLAPRKPGCDVTMKARARTLGEQPAQSLPVRLAVYRGNAPLLRKAVVAVGRTRPDGSVESLTSAPLGWGRAVAGPSNPVGSPTPSVFLIDAQGRASQGVPGGFGPIPIGWQPRRARIDEETRRGLSVTIPSLPDDVDWRAFMCAPDDQQVPHLVGGEWILVDGISRTLARVQSQLPVLRARALVVTGSEGGVESVTGVNLVWDTLAIDGEKLVAHAVFRADLPATLPTPARPIAVLLKFNAANDEVPPRHELFAPENLRPALSRATQALGETQGLTIDDHETAARGPTIPFAAAIGATSAERARPTSAGEEPRSARPPWLEAAQHSPPAAPGRAPITAEIAVPRPPTAAPPTAASPAPPRETLGQKFAMRGNQPQPSALAGPGAGVVAAPVEAKPQRRAMPGGSKAELVAKALRKSGMSEARIAEVLKEIRRDEGGDA